jgi:Kef-type K+ transport system membrane component KefB
LDYNFLWQLAVILIFTKLLGMMTRRIELPQVVGALLAGILLGPACFKVISDTSFLDDVAELGVIVLMFTAGLETDIQALKKSGKACFVIALIGVIVPLLLGWWVSSFFNPGQTLQNIFIGVILTATSVSITVETLKELGKLSTESGNAILGAAIIDDVLGIICLTVITSLGGNGAGNTDIVMVLIKIVLFFVISIALGVFLLKYLKKWFNNYNNDKQRFIIVAFAMCLGWSFVAEHFFGVADITGAYMVGVLFASTPRVQYLQNRFGTISYMLLSPVFFASIGLKVVLPQMTSTIVIFSLLLIVVAIFSKIIGCGLGAKICGYSNDVSLRIGVGMVSRGEVALIVANQGLAYGLMNQDLFGPVILVVIVTTVLTPILLKWVYSGGNGVAVETNNAITQNVENLAAYDQASDNAPEVSASRAAAEDNKHDDPSHPAYQKN